MKKLTLVLAALLLVSAGAFAVDASVEASIEGDASVTWGIDLDSGVHGIKGASSSNLSITLVGEQTEEKGEGTVYGWIKLKEFKAETDDITYVSGVTFDDPLTAENEEATTTETKRIIVATKPGVEARLYLGVPYINILFGNGDNEINFAAHGKDYAPGLGIEGVTAAVDGSLGNTNPAETYSGLSVVLPLEGLLEFTLGLTSSDDWTATAANTYNIYTKVNLTAVEGLTLAAAFSFEGAGSVPGLGAEIGYDLGIAALKAGFDMNLSGTNPYDLGVGLLVKPFEGSKLEDKEFFGRGKTNYEVGLGVGFSFDSANSMDLSVSLYDGELIPVLDLVALVELADLGGANSFALGVRADAAIDPATIFAEFWTSTVTKLKVGVDLNVIDNTTFTLAYTSGDLQAATPVAGTVEVTTKIAY